jgi:hypothetical protein
VGAGRTLNRPDAIERRRHVETGDRDAGIHHAWNGSVHYRAKGSQLRVDRALGARDREELDLHEVARNLQMLGSRRQCCGLWIGHERALKLAKFAGQPGRWLEGFSHKLRCACDLHTDAALLRNDRRLRPRQEEGNTTDSTRQEESRYQGAHIASLERCLEHAVGLIAQATREGQPQAHRSSAQGCSSTPDSGLMAWVVPP